MCRGKVLYSSLQNNNHVVSHIYATYIVYTFVILLTKQIITTKH